ncbi:MAG: EAL domain-containing protein [Neptunomonas phycophila]|uniref:putative bifunctional diguanylate cyclase/phosphodiesterase n=1 Tax=Neptunomonas phycophila TaxID=1572645 RepID=UPI003B8B4BF8
MTTPTTQPSRPHLMLHERPQPVWPFMMVGFDPDLCTHIAHLFSDYAISGHAIKVMPCHTTEKALQQLLERRYALVVINAGLLDLNDPDNLVRVMREDFQQYHTRYIVVDSEPGETPMAEWLLEMHIQDYRHLQHINDNDWLMIVTQACQNYQLSMANSRQERGLEKVISATTDLLNKASLRHFAEGILDQLSACLGLNEDGLICVQRRVRTPSSPCSPLYITAATGQHASLIGEPLSQLAALDIQSAFETCIEQQGPIFDTYYTALYYNNSRWEGAIYIDCECCPSDDYQQLLEIFASNISQCNELISKVNKLSFIAYHDTLTKVPNRTRFLLELDQRAKTQDVNTVIALIDLSHFADLNEGLGVETGNRLLINVTERLQNYLGDTCYIARIGADVFGLIGQQQDLNPDSIRATFSAPFDVGELSYSMRYHVGLCRLLAGEMTGLTLLKRSYIALARAKRNSARNYEFFLEEMEFDNRWRTDIINQLKNDFYEGHLSLWYQPQINLKTGAVCGIEALVRWPDSAGGFIQPPSIFIPLAEYSGLIIDIGDWILEEACRTFDKLKRQQHTLQSVCVNIGIPQFKQFNLIKTIQRLTQEYKLPAGTLVIEVTEQLAMHDPQLVIENLHTLQKLGVHAAIDDFGTGYSSLNTLRHLAIDRLKIDTQFIHEISHSNAEHARPPFAETLISLGQKLGLKLVAEGVETQAQANTLRQIGCHQAQGFFFAKPMPFDELLDWLNDNPSLSF